MIRRDKINYYLDIAESVLKRGTCMRRKFGAIIVKNDEIISRRENAMNSAVRCMLKPTRSSRHPAAK